MATRRKRMHWSGSVMALAVLAILVAGCAGPIDIGANTRNEITLSATGGLALLLEASCTQPSANCTAPGTLILTKNMLYQRIHIGLDMSNMVALTEPNNRILVELPNYSDQQNAVALLTQPGQLVMFGSPQQLAQGSSVAGQTCVASCQPGQYQVRFTGGNEIDPASVAATADPGSHQPVVTFTFGGEGRDQFASYTHDNIGSFLNIAVDDVVIESAAIQSEIDGPIAIGGFASAQQARDLAAMLVSGPLWMTLHEVSAQQVKPGQSVTLGV